MLLSRLKSPRSVLYGALMGWSIWVIYVLLARPPMLDEVPFAYMAREPFGPFCHPPLFFHLMGILFHVFGATIEQLRLLGVLTFILSGWMSWRLAETWKPGAGLWAIALLVTNSLAMHGFLMLDIDNTLLTAWMVAGIWLLTRTEWPLTKKGIVIHALWFALGLWMKFSTPFIWPFALLAVYVYRKDWARGIGHVLAILVLGLGVFLIVWTGYTRLAGLDWNLIFSGRIVEMLERGAADTGSSTLRELLERLIRVGLWIGPMAIVFWGVSSLELKDRWKALKHPEAWIATLFCGWGLLLGYILVGGVIWSFAKYHAPIIPLFAIAGGVVIQHWLDEARPGLMGWGVFLIGLVGVWSYWAVGDLIYLINHDVRRAMLFSPELVGEHLKHFVLRFGLLLMSVPIVFGFLWGLKRRLNLSVRSAVGSAVAFCTLGAGIGFMVLQMRADYSTTYTYGRSFETFYAVQRFALAHHAKDPDARMMTPYDTFQWQLEPEIYGAVFVNQLFAAEDVETLKETLQDPTVTLFVYDPDFSPTFFYHTIYSHPEVQALLGQNFYKVLLGDAVAWVKRRRSGDRA